MTSRRNFIAFAAVASVAEILGVAKVLAAADHLVRTDAEWRKLLSPAQFRVLREAGTEYPFTSPLLNDTGKACSAAQVANSRCFPRRQNSTAARVGRASGRLWTTRFKRPRTIRSAWSDRRFRASAATAISGMSSMTGRSRPACAIA